MEIGISTGIIYKYDLLKNLFLIKEAGFNIVEICFKPCAKGDKCCQFDYQNWLYIHEIKDKLKSYGLRVHSIHAPYASDFDISCLDEKRRRNIVFEVKNIIDILRFLDGNILVIHPTVKEVSKDNFEERRNWFNQARESLKDILSYAEKKGVKVAVENLLPHLFFGDFIDLFNLVNQFDSKSLGVCLDTSHANLNKGIQEAIEKFSQKIISLHVSDNYGKEDSHFPIGEGNIDWKEFLNELARINFREVFMLEILKEVNKNELPGMLKLAYERTRSLLEEGS